MSKGWRGWGGGQGGEGRETGGGGGVSSHLRPRCHIRGMWLWTTLDLLLNKCMHMRVCRCDVRASAVGVR